MTHWMTSLNRMHMTRVSADPAVLRYELTLDCQQRSYCTQQSFTLCNRVSILQNLEQSSSYTGCPESSRPNLCHMRCQVDSYMIFFYLTSLTPKFCTEISGHSFHLQNTIDTTVQSIEELSVIFYF